MASWQDLFKIFTYSFEPDPLSKESDPKKITGAGVTQPDAIPDIRQDGSYWGGGKGQIRLRDSNDFIDLSSISNRQSRYKEYERLRNVPEIEMAMTVFSDETCVTGDTKITTLVDGPKTIKWLTENKADKEFLVYCWNFKTEDFDLGWGFNPRKVKKAKIVKIILNNASFIRCTPEHRILLKTGQWIEAGNLKARDEIMAFYRLPVNKELNRRKNAQFPRIYTHRDGWKHEKHFIEDWNGIEQTEKTKKLHKLNRMVGSGLGLPAVAKYFQEGKDNLGYLMESNGYSITEIRHLGKKRDFHTVINVIDLGEEDVYDLSVKDHENFCTDSIVMHNCQKGENKHVCDLTLHNQAAKEDLEHLLFNRNMLNIDRKVWGWSKSLYCMGDLFLELIIDPNDPKAGIIGATELPAESVFRIETTKGKVVEFQQAKEGPDYESLTRAPITHATEAELQQSRALRFAPQQIVHMKIGDDRRTFYPYGQSLIEPARGPAHQLRLMEDSMVVYRLSRAPERRVYYIDVGGLSPFKAEALMDRLKDQLKKKKIVNNKGGAGASGVEERYYAPPVDEDIWVPTRPNTNTRIETLPGAQNLGEVDDSIYFRNKLFVALNFPKNYFSNEDQQATRISLSAQDVKFARMIERLQSHIEDGLWEIACRHLRLRGYPEEDYEDLIIKMTPPSDWRELSRAEIITNRMGNAGSLKSSQLMSDYDILTKWLKYDADETKEMLSRLKLQKMEDLKLNILAQNPALLGVGIPGKQDQKEIGAEAGGPVPEDLGQTTQPQEAPPSETPSTETPEEKPKGKSPTPLPDISPEDLKKYDLEIHSYNKEQDREEVDYSEQ